jgi:hypothetical protein
LATPREAVAVRRFLEGGCAPWAWDVAWALAGLAMSSAGCERGAETAGDRASVGVGADMDTTRSKRESARLVIVARMQKTSQPACTCVSA